MKTFHFVAYIIRFGGQIAELQFIRFIVAVHSLKLRTLLHFKAATSFTLENNHVHFVYE